MAIYRYTASADTTITDAYAADLFTKGTGSNMGESDSLEIFSLFAQVSQDSIEKARILIKFPTEDIVADRTLRKIPQSGSVNFYLNMFNAKHPFTLPKKFTLVVSPISSSWEEGRGLDMEDYSDIGYANWLARSSGSSGENLWTSPGGDFIDDASVTYEQYFEKGTENLSVDVTTLVESWIDGTYNNNGFAIYLTSSQEDGSLLRSFYTKKFFARGTEFFFKRPVIEARWNSSRKDQAGLFFRSSSLATAEDNLNNIYLYNSIRGRMRNIPSVGEGSIFVSIYDTLGGSPITLPQGGGVVADGDTNITGAFDDTGIYKASFAYTSSQDSIYAVWHDGTNEFFTSSLITVRDFNSYSFDPNESYHLTVKDLKPYYSKDDNARFELFVRKKDWSPTIYTVSTNTPEPEIIENIYYKINRVIDNYEVIGYGTGSENHTLLSYDASGSYFDLDMKMLQRDYLYEISFLFEADGRYLEQEQKFKFRVE